MSSYKIGARSKLLSYGITSETGWRQLPKSGSHCARGRSRKLSRKHFACGSSCRSSFFNPPNPEQKLMEMEGSYFQKKLSRNVPPPNTLNPKMKIPLYLQSVDKFWAERWRRRNNPMQFVTGVVFCSSSKGATTEILSRDRVPGTNVVTGISRKPRGRSAEATGCVWEYLATLSLPQYQFAGDRLWFEPSMTSPTPPLNKLPNHRLWFELGQPQPRPSK